MLALSSRTLALPGFTWLTPTSFVLGLVESAIYGAYVGLVEPSPPVDPP